MDRIWVHLSPSSFLSGISGSEEFFYLLLCVLVQYGGLIANGMYEHACHLGSQVNGVLTGHQPQGQEQSQPVLPENLPEDQRTVLSVDQANQPGKQTQTDTVNVDDDKPKDAANTATTRPSCHTNTQRLPNLQNVEGGHGRRGGHSNHEVRTDDTRCGTTSRSSDDDNVDEDERLLMEAIKGMKLELGEKDDDSGDNKLYRMSDIAGLEDVKEALEEFACVFLHFPHLTRQLKQRSSTGLLLFGPQGTGKTLLVRSFARQYNLALYDIRASAVLSKYVGEAEKFVRALFRQVRKDAPAILLLDECDGLLARATGSDSGNGLRLLQNELKNQWSDLIYSRAEVLVVGATNKPHDIDLDGFGRRLSLKLHVDLPGGRACRQVLASALGRLRSEVKGDSEEMEVLGHLCAERKLSGYDIHCLVEGLLRRALRTITRSTHFRKGTWDGKPTLVPCCSTDDGARSGSWRTITLEDDAGGAELSYVPFAFGDVHAAILRAKPTVDAEMRAKHKLFAAVHSPRRSEEEDDD